MRTNQRIFVIAFSGTSRCGQASGDFQNPTPDRVGSPQKIPPAKLSPSNAGSPFQPNSGLYSVSNLA